MTPVEYVKIRQRLWAERRGIPLTTSTGTTKRGTLAYTQRCEDNLFRPLSKQTQYDLQQGDGQELGNGSKPGRIHALHSSSAFACNVFDYWRANHQLETILRACRLPSTRPSSLRFEAHLPIAARVDRARFPRDPNLDVLIECGTRKALAIESKFLEPFSGRGHNGLKKAYLDLRNEWEGLQACRELGSKISPDDKKHTHLHVAQLLKHILGLKHAYTKSGFRLLYLWYDVPGPEGTQHRQEIDDFVTIVARDGIVCQSMTYQELIINLACEARGDHKAYVDYLAERYL